MIYPLPPALIEYGWHVATVQFSRAVRDGYARVAGTVAGDGRRGLSKLNSMHGLELGGMPRWLGQVRSTFLGRRSLEAIGGSQEESSLERR